MTLSTFDHIIEQVIVAFQECFPDVAINRQSDFFELGGDSLAVAGLCVSLEARFNTEIHPSSVLYHPTVEELAYAVKALLASPEPATRDLKA
ncbi:acyl carrier protein [Sulfitobacter guttiformis]|uniref:Acyl carrier protein n=1 Tax=Sulfitobacter guttiformis TaxID=74349 RepID=A0A420DHP3_9RHOB|nr:acyl carrier protein [Sulfitobacter guttiformis]